MLTFKHISDHAEYVGQCDHVIVRMGDGNHPASSGWNEIMVVGCSPLFTGDTRNPGSDIAYIRSGTVYVMNENGKTVATYHLLPLPIGDSMSAGYN